ncbi:hypothetical protein F442_18673 [Phytophthora nicotianae P10297]|uniref:PX domain-containing protein n=3 Tax=Phytophthora nicotianae TaxID=4792 RepID=W2YEV2_PHYNI|nr:hypothetical protein F442_18673 [Phytophthora nicotianae P10297]
MSLERHTQMATIFGDKPDTLVRHWRNISRMLFSSFCFSHTVVQSKNEDEACAGKPRRSIVLVAARSSNQQFAVRRSLAAWKRSLCDHRACYFSSRNVPCTYHAVQSTMIDEDSISVVITASKEVEGGDTLDNGEGNIKLHSKRNKYTIYTVFVRNVTTGGKCVVRRRYSDFFKLRKELMELVSWGHCGFCEQYVQQIAGYPFPRRRLLRSSRAAVVKERMDSLGLFLRHMLLCIMARSFENCSQACENIENCILKSFLQMDQTETLFPTMASKQRPIDILQAMEEKRQQQIKAAGLRTKSLAYTTLSDQSDQSRLSRNQRQVGTDTCHLCLQKWTHCYCNSDQDSIYPVNVARVSNGYESPVHERPSVSMVESDTSRCSRCENDWNHCYCCQQVSPTASSVCTDR